MKKKKISKIHSKEKSNKLKLLNRKNPLTGLTFSQRYQEILKERQKLPAMEAKSKFLELIENEDIIIIQGETGSGKTTQIPQFLLQTSFTKKGMIAVTQPRRIAAISVAKRVSQETDTILGEQIGYTIRFDDQTSKSTQLKYLTDGMLIRELISDPNLLKYSVIILDEAHERTLNTDILLGILKILIRKRKDSESRLKLVLMSATIEIDKFVNYFEHKAPVLTIPGRQHEVEVYFRAQPEENYLQAAIDTTIQIHLSEKSGDILVFLTGEDEIEEAIAKITIRLQSYQEQCKPFLCLPLYGALPSQSQQKIFQQAPNQRKIIVSTNIAETSVTIDGIVYVVDAGLSKQKIYNPRMKYESLLVAPISKASAKQRAGRAGRTKAGKCYRLYTELSYLNELDDFTIPEILRSELSSTILQLNMLGVSNVANFDFVEPPSPECMSRALETLVYVGALDEDNGGLTLLGKTLGNFPLEPRLGVVLMKSKELGCSNEVLNALAILTAGNYKYRPRDCQDQADMKHKEFRKANCDYLTSNNVMQAFEASHSNRKLCKEYFFKFRVLNAAVRIKKQLKSILFQAKSFIDHSHRFKDFTLDNKIKICFLAGFFQQIAFNYKKRVYKVFNDDHQVLIHPGSVVTDSPQWKCELD